MKKPKLSHHIDGKAHISWNWIISWYDKNWKSKWMSIKSFNLNSKNDWWPVFWFHIKKEYLNLFKKMDFWELNKNLRKKKSHLIIPEKFLLNYKKNNKIDYIWIEWFYFHKSELPKSFYKDWINDYLYKQHPIYWEIKLYPLATPDQCPYIFGLFFYLPSLLPKEKNTKYIPFVFWWSPWEIKSDWSWECINIMYNDDESFPNIEVASLLNYNP